MAGGSGCLAEDEVFGDWCRREVGIEEQATISTVGKLKAPEET